MVLLFDTTPSPKNLRRRDFLLERFSRQFPLPETNILEIGCGNGRYGTLLGPHVRSYLGIDTSIEYLAHARKQPGEYVAGDAERLPLDGTFNIVFYANSWHFMHDHAKALSEAGRVLHPRGIVAIIEPTERSAFLSPALRKGGPEFDANRFREKMEALNRAQHALLADERFYIADALPVGDEMFWLLKRNELR